MIEHPVEQEIDYIQIDTVVGECHVVGDKGVTKIEACDKSGMHSNIPYLRVWAGEKCVAEFCQHQIVGVFFK